jgi:hypothetical protein
MRYTHISIGIVGVLLFTELREAGAGVIPASVMQWRSVRTHGAVGPLGIVLSATASGNGPAGPTAEPRLGGVQRIDAVFNQPVVLANTAGITVVGRTTTGSLLGGPVAYTPSSVVLSGTSTLQINFAPGTLPDQTCYTITLPADVVVGEVAGDRDVNVRSLYADTTSDGRVSLSDALLIKSHAGQSVLTQPQYDLDLSIGISQTDALSAKGRVSSPPVLALCP